MNDTITPEAASLPDIVDSLPGHLNDNFERLQKALSIVALGGSLSEVSYLIRDLPAEDVALVVVARYELKAARSAEPTPRLSPEEQSAILGIIGAAQASSATEILKTLSEATDRATQTAAKDEKVRDWFMREHKVASDMAARVQGETGRPQFTQPLTPEAYAWILRLAKDSGVDEKTPGGAQLPDFVSVATRREQEAAVQAAEGIMSQSQQAPAEMAL